ncbi:glycosyltransferase [candidate division KSB1 bacterium]|nr:glycosyltransferase [candidate division KSB1 bacterium]
MSCDWLVVSSGWQTTHVSYSLSPLTNHYSPLTKKSMIILYFITALLTISYSSIIFILFFRLFINKPGKNPHELFVSVVVAARNEEKHIGNCLQALVTQSYAESAYEIIIVDDRSVDDTAAIVRKYAQRNHNVKIIQVKELPENISPKKNALETGIRAAKGEIILTTDADCEPVKDWIKTVVTYFEPEVGLVAGFSPTESSKKPTLFSKLFTLDSISLAALTASSFKTKKPLTVSGRNLAYRKSVFEEINGFQKISHHISGDDDLLLHKVVEETNWKLNYALDPRASVKTRIPDSFRQFANQRIRHASKGRFYSTWLKLFLAGIYLFNLLLILLLPISIVTPNVFILWLGAIGLKSISEFLFLFRFAAIFNYKKIFYVFPLAVLLHPFYVVVFGLWGQFGKFEWKE